MNRRDFLKLSGMAAVALGSAGSLSLFWRGSEAIAAELSLDLNMLEVMAEMVDGVQVPMWAFEATSGVDHMFHGPRIPGPVIFAVEGDDLEINVTNSLGTVHAFSIPGVVNSGNITPGATERVRFRAPAPGTYLYFDPLNAPVNRVMGLHGAMVVLPRNPLTPYSNPTSNIERLFEDFGTASHFPGHPWDPARTWIWLINSVDPVKNTAAAANPSISPATFTSGYLSQYFTISGKSGFFASHDEHIAPSGNVGQPALIRSLNAGLVTHSLHIHGNHVYLLSEEGTVRSNVFLVDTWTLPPLARRDVMLPFIQPPDIPEAKWPPVQELFPLLYPMHCHTEPSQTAAGGNYPQGLVTHFSINGPVDASNVVILVDKADISVRFGKIHLEGRASGGAAGAVLTIRAGSSATGTPIGTATVGSDGRWSYRGRALKTLANRRVSVTSATPAAERLDIRLRIR